jgi:prepilin-type N-terminal cleavage/methylation domain-containing protein
MRYKLSGFTLIEVLIAMLLFVIAAAGLLTLFPVAHRTERESVQETRASLIASGIMESLGPTDQTENAKIPCGVSHGSTIWEPVDPSARSSHTLLYNSACQPIRPVDAEDTASGVTEPDAVAVATLDLEPLASMPHLTRAEVSVASPASAPAPRRVIHRYVTLLFVP